MNKKLCTAILSAFILITSCSDSDAKEETLDNQQLDENFEKEVEQNTGIENIQPATFEAIGIDDKTLEIKFEMESDECFGHQVEVIESDLEIVVAVMTGELPDKNPDDCDYGVYTYTTKYDLESPVNGRTIVPQEEGEPSQSEASNLDVS